MPNSLNCLHCGQIVQRGRYLQVNIEATRGPRLNVQGGGVTQGFSPHPTHSQAILCHDCIEKPELEPLYRLISPPLAETSMHAGKRCVVLCRGRAKPFFWFAGLRRRVGFWPSFGWHKCPLCGQAAVCWPAPQSPIRYSEEAEKLAAGQLPGRTTTRRTLPARTALLDQGDER